MKDPLTCSKWRRELGWGTGVVGPGLASEVSGVSVRGLPSQPTRRETGTFTGRGTRRYRRGHFGGWGCPCSRYRR